MLFLCVINAPAVVTASSHRRTLFHRHTWRAFHFYESDSTRNFPLVFIPSVIDASSSVASFPCILVVSHQNCCTPTDYVLTFILHSKGLPLSYFCHHRILELSIWAFNPVLCIPDMKVLRWRVSNVFHLSSFCKNYDYSCTCLHTLLTNVNPRAVLYHPLDCLASIPPPTWHICLIRVALLADLCSYL